MKLLDIRPHSERYIRVEKCQMICDYSSCFDLLSEKSLS